MCAIVGLWRSPAPPSASLREHATAMATALSHRGPDDAGLWLHPEAGLALAHRRLAILDLSPAGHQPMRSTSGRFLIAFNGEIYNHLHLRHQLEQEGRLSSPWRGHSDTETLLAAIEAWGLEITLQRSAGMFALALWDHALARLTLARDRFGEKPLYISGFSSRGLLSLAFASDLAALRALPDGPPFTIDPAGLAAYLRLGCLPAPLSIHQHVRQLPPAHLLHLHAPALTAELEPLAWWDPCSAALTAAADPLADTNAALDLLQATLQEVVTDQSLADVPLGTFLSGGLDSSLITALLQSTGPRPARSFTIAFPDTGGGAAGFNEAPHARAIAAHLGTEHTEIALTARDVRDLIPQLPRLWSEPFADSSQIPTHLVCREARRSGLTVALSGDGGDELFGGYNRHRLGPSLHRRLGSLSSPWRRLLARGLDQLPLPARGLVRDKRRKLADALRAADSLSSLHASLTRVWHDPSHLLSPAWCQAAGAAACLAPLPLPPAPSPAEQLMLADILSYLPNDILVKVDRAAMAVGLETRAPFLDPRVATLAWSLPLDLKIPSASTARTGKWILRQLLLRYVPASLVDRPKAGFAVPLGAWLRGPLRSWADSLLDPHLLRRQGFLRPEPIQRLWQQHLHGQADHAPRLWAVLMWQAWLAEWEPS